MDMRMTESAAWMVGLMGFLVVVTAAILIGVRVYGGRAAHSDHPHPPEAERRALEAAATAPVPAVGAAPGAAPERSVVQRRGDAVEDVGLRHHQ